MNRLLLITLFSSFSLFSQHKSVVVLELFTSQGCSSCPPADKVLKEINDNMDSEYVIPIAYHVDYWNYIGWKDPFSTKEFTDIQRYYGQKFRSNSIYTPQLIINGNEHVVGSNEVTIHKKIKRYLKKSSKLKLDISETIKEENGITISFNINGKVNNSILEALIVVDEKTTNVTRGENRNRTIVNSNIVVARTVGNINKNSGNIHIKTPKIINQEDKLRLVLVLKDEDLYVQTAAQIKL
ncbi:MAG: DUF1223 domain-containing protein [Tenacibaculum sp.]|nr:DUF1223 domain-containing protein [Tenacibaculum sp.]